MRAYLLARYFRHFLFGNEEVLNENAMKGIETLTLLLHVLGED